MQLKFEIESEFDHFAVATAKTEHGELKITVSRDDPDNSDDEIRAQCEMEVTLTRADGSVVQRKSDMEFHDDIRDALVDQLDDEFPDNDSVADFVDTQTAKRKKNKP